MITVTLIINGTNLSGFIKYPIQYTKKNLDESLNLLTLTLYGTSITTPFKPNTVADIVITDGTTTLIDGQMVVSGDTIERVGVTDRYHHKISFIELTYLLSLEILPDMTITRITVVPDDQIGTVYTPSLADVVDKILKYSEGTFSKTLTLGTATRNILAAVQSPELTFTRYTTLEALRLVFAIAKIVPFCLVEGFLNHLSVTNSTADLSSYVAKSEAYDANQFRTRLYSPVENFIGGGDLEGSIIEPATRGWISTRSVGTTDVKADSVSWKTTRDIYKLEKLQLKTYAYYETIDTSVPTITRVVLVDFETNSNFATWFGVPNVQEGLIDLVDLGYVYEKSFYDLLPNTNAGKGQSLYYEQGRNQILGLSNIPESYDDFWAPEDQAIRQIVKNVLTDWEDFKPLPAYDAAFKSYMSALHAAQFGTGGGQTLFRYGRCVDGCYGHFDSTNNYVSTTQVPSSGYFVNYTDMRARITYTPYINTKLITYKERKETDDPTHETTVFYNQSANTISDETLAELHDKVIKRGNAPTETIKKFHTSLSAIPDLGRQANKYVITAEDIQILPDHVNVEYVLSKDYAKLNQYVAVLEKYRQFAIPSERVVDRQFTINEFAKFSRTPVTKTSSLLVSSYMGTNEANIILMNTSASYKLPDDATTYATPVMAFAATNFAFNNALVFETKFQSNASAGGETEAYLPGTTPNTDRRIEKPIPYTDNTGYFETLTTVSLGTNISTSFSLVDSHEYPIFTGEALSFTHFTRSNVDIDKDARERLTLSYMLHHIDTTGIVYLNRGWALRNGLIGGPGYSGLKFAYFNLRPLEGKPSIINYNAVGTYPNINITNDSFRVTITHTAGTVYNSNYWGVIDENGDLLFWVDEACTAGVAPAPMYINFSNTY